MIELGARRSDKDLERSLPLPAQQLSSRLEAPVKTRQCVVYTERVDGRVASQALHPKVARLSMDWGLRKGKKWRDQQGKNELNKKSLPCRKPGLLACSLQLLPLI
jgi:hypothetical protein